MNSTNAISELINYYNTVHPQNLDWPLMQEKVLDLRRNLDPAHTLSAQEDYVLRYLSVLHEYYRDQSQINYDFIEEGIDLGHIHSISYAASLLSFGVYGFSNHRQKILSGCSEILKLGQAPEKHRIFEILVNDCDRGDYLGASDIMSQHDFADCDFKFYDGRPLSFYFGNLHIAERVFSIPEWIKIARFFEMHAEGIKEQQDTGKAINYSQCLSVGNYRFYAVKYPDVAHITMRLPGVTFFKQSISNEEDFMEFRYLIDELKEFIFDLENSASYAFSDPSLFLSNLSARATDD